MSCNTKIETALLLCIFAPLAGCDGERRAIREAVDLHGRGIAHIATFAPYLRDPAVGVPSAVWLYGARAARVEILRQAGRAQDLRGPWRQPAPPVARIAQALEVLIWRCSFAPAEDGARERRRATECLEGIGVANEALAREDALATTRGLPRGTVPQIGPAAIGDDAREAARALAERLQPPPAERDRQELFASGAEPVVLLLACDKAITEAQDAVPGLASEIEGACFPVREGERLLRQIGSCGGEGPPCGDPGPCAALTGLAGDPALPASFRERLRAVARRCAEPAEAPAEPEGRWRHRR